jgi:hypothetical protein
MAALIMRSITAPLPACGRAMQACHTGNTSNVGKSGRLMLAIASMRACNAGHYAPIRE